MTENASRFNAPHDEEVQPLRFATREEWLVAAIDAMRPWFASIDAELPPAIRVSVGFTIGTASENAATRGVTYTWASGTDDTNHVFISPELGEAFEVLRTLWHELVHVSDAAVLRDRSATQPSVCGSWNWGSHRAPAKNTRSPTKGHQSVVPRLSE